MRALGMCVWLSAVGLSACAGAAGGASAPVGERASMEKLCAAEVASGAISAFPFFEKTTRLNAWIEANVDDAALRTLFFEELPRTLATEQAKLLQTEADKRGVASCPLVAYVAFISALSYDHGNVDCVEACVARNEGAVDDVQATCSTGCGG
jgi:hypothetical protein